MDSTTYELKYCERCGTLKLRPVASVSTYCRRCEELLARFTFARGSDGTRSAKHSAPPVGIEGRRGGSLRREGSFDSGGAKRALPALRMTRMAEASGLAGRVQ